MTEWRYEIQTKIPRDFNPKIEGATLDSIIGSCPNVINWKIPWINRETIIIFDTKNKIRSEEIVYLKEQLKGEFDNNYFNIKQIKKGARDSSGCLNF